MTIDERINEIIDWIGGNVGHRTNNEGQIETDFDAVSLTRLLREHFVETDEDGYGKGWEAAEKDFNARIL